MVGRRRCLVAVTLVYLNFSVSQVRVCMKHCHLSEIFDVFVHKGEGIRVFYQHVIQLPVIDAEAQETPYPGKYDRTVHLVVAWLYNFSGSIRLTFAAANCRAVGIATVWAGVYQSYFIVGDISAMFKNVYTLGVPGHML